MEHPLILNKLEEEYLLCALQSASRVRGMNELYRWSQGEIQGLLPHSVLVCLVFNEHNEVLRIEALHDEVFDAKTLDVLCEQHKGLAIRLATYCRANKLLPCVIETAQRNEEHALRNFHSEVSACGLGSALVHGTEPLPGGATFFALFSPPGQSTRRHAAVLDMLLPWLHLAVLRAVGNEAKPAQPAPASTPKLTAREIEILGWVMKGKSNFEVSVIVELSPLTVKNHMQKIFKKLNVHNRAQAVAHYQALESRGAVPGH